MSPKDEANLELAIDKLDRVIRALGEHNFQLEQRLATLYRSFFVAFSLLVLSISFLVIILSRQMPDIAHAIATMNAYFTTVSNEMSRVDRSMRIMKQNLGSMPHIITHVDRINGDMTYLSNDVGTMATTMDNMDDNMGRMTVNMADMRNSFEAMDQTVYGMGRSVDQMSKPMHMINWMMPFR